MSACLLDVCHIHIGWTWISTRDRAPCDRPTWFFCLADWPALGPSCSPGPMWSRSGRRVLRGTAWPQTLHCLARLLTHPSHTRHPVLQYLCCLCVCVCVSVFAGLSQSLCFLCLSTGCRHLRSQMCALFAQDNSLCIWKQTTHKKQKKMKRPTVVCLSWIWKFLKIITTVFVVQSPQLVSGVGSQVASAEYR